jgi:hypothetical protein
MFLQYHNFAKLGFLPYQWPPFGPNEGGIHTRLATANDAIGQQCFLILGAGEPRRTFFLWEAFLVQKVTLHEHGYHVAGPGWMLSPPRVLEGQEFRQFQKSCEDFRSFRSIADMAYAETLKRYAEEAKEPTTGEATLEFCDRFVAVTNGHEEARLLRAYARHRLGDRNGAMDDCRIACRTEGAFGPDATRLMATI